MDVDDNTDDWLGCPTPLEMYKHQCAMLEDELIETQAMLRKGRANIAGLVQMNDVLATVKALAEKELAKAKAEIPRLNYQNWELGNKIHSLKIVADGRDHLFRENQRLLMELKVLRPPSPQFVSVCRDLFIQIAPVPSSMMPCCFVRNQGPELIRPIASQLLF